MSSKADATPAQWLRSHIPTVVPAELSAPQTRAPWVGRGDGLGLIAGIGGWRLCGVEMPCSWPPSGFPRDAGQEAALCSWGLSSSLAGLGSLLKQRSQCWKPLPGAVAAWEGEALLGVRGGAGLQTVLVLAAVFFRNLCARGSRGPEEQGGHDPGLHVRHRPPPHPRRHRRHGAESAGACWPLRPRHRPARLPAQPSSRRPGTMQGLTLCLNM